MSPVKQYMVRYQCGDDEPRYANIAALGFSDAIAALKHDQESAEVLSCTNTGEIEYVTEAAAARMGYEPKVVKWPSIPAEAGA